MSGIAFPIPGREVGVEKQVAAQETHPVIAINSCPLPAWGLGEMERRTILPRLVRS